MPQLMSEDDQSPSQGEVTQWLMVWSDGDSAALDKLMALLIADLRRRADYILRNQAPGHVLQPEALVNEAYLKLVGNSASCKNRAHFLALAGRVMRNILIDHARARLCSSRSGRWCRLSHDAAIAIPAEIPQAWIDLDEALNRLAETHPRASAVVQMRHFAGATVNEVATALNVSRITVLREWKVAVEALRLYLSPVSTG